MAQRTNDHYDAVIIGGGHNGLVCACYLAKANLKVKVLEKRDIVGGAAVTESFAQGFRNSVASYTVSLLNPKIIKDLNLYQNGLKIIKRPVANFLPVSSEHYLLIQNDLAETQKSVAQFSKRDAKMLPDYYEQLQHAADMIRDLLLEAPPNLGGGIMDLFQTLKLGHRFSKLDIKQQRFIYDLFTKSAGEMLDGFFESDPIKAAFGFDSIVGNFASPYTNGSAYVLLHHVFGEVNGSKGSWGHAIGGMGAITQAMAKEAQKRGVDISTDAEVSEVLVKTNKAMGVILKNGKKITAERVIANINPKLLYLKLIDHQHLDADFLRHMQGYRCQSATFRMNVALDSLPDFICKPGVHQQLQHSAGIIIAPTLDYMEQAYLDAKQLGWSKQPIIEVLIPSTIDDSLAPPGKHVASLFCQHFNPNLPHGQSWDELKDQAASTIIDTVTQYAPNFRQSILATKILSPLDLERTFGLVGGDIFHGALGLDQLYSARPMMGYAQYRGPLKGLYICGSGAHPGGGVTGIPGHNAAHEIIKDMRKFRFNS